MEYLISEVRDRDYGSSIVRTIVSFDEYLAVIEDITRGHCGYVNAIVKRQTPWPLRWFSAFRCSYDVYVMVLDCDGTDEMLAACHMLAFDNLNYALVQSSPSHYWIITDYVDTLERVIAKMQTIPGVDQNLLAAF